MRKRKRSGGDKIDDGDVNNNKHHCTNVVNVDVASAFGAHSHESQRDARHRVQDHSAGCDHVDLLPLDASNPRDFTLSLLCRVANCSHIIESISTRRCGPHSPHCICLSHHPSILPSTFIFHPSFHNKKVSVSQSNGIRYCAP